MHTLFFFYFHAKEIVWKKHVMCNQCIVNIVPFCFCSLLNLPCMHLLKWYETPWNNYNDELQPWFNNFKSEYLTFVSYKCNYKMNPKR